MRKIHVLLSVAVVFMSACASQGSRDYDEYAAWKKTLPEPNADYGTIPDKPQQIIKKHLNKILKDPDSAKYFEFTAPQKSFFVSDQKTRKTIYGYAVCGYVNAKNSYGAYTGQHMFWFLIKNEEVIRQKDLSIDNFDILIYSNNLSKCLSYSN
ncbi:MAG: hypothetical protein LWW83_16035 [Azonexaceae bacterium]|nr:hypothetical protein [Azonexaceae bacterium]